MITMIAIGVEHPGKKVLATVDNDFYLGFLGVTDIIFAYGGPLEISDLKINKTNLCSWPCGILQFYRGITRTQGFPEGTISPTIY